MCLKDAHPHAFINVPVCLRTVRKHTHINCITLVLAVGKLQHWLLMFHNIVYLYLRFRFFFFQGHTARGKVWEGFGGGSGVQTHTIFSPSLVLQCFSARQTQSHVWCAFMN